MTQRLQAFVAATEAIVADAVGEAAVLAGVTQAMRALIAHDDWLPEAMARPDPRHYCQYLLHLDPQERFSVVSFVWGPGQRTPVHDHTTWGVIGMLRGSELSQGYAMAPGRLVPQGAPARLVPGDVATVSPRIGDIHQVGNAFDDRVSISIHAYGADIGRRRRHVFDLQTGAAKDFVSSYSNAAQDQP